MSKASLDLHNNVNFAALPFSAISLPVIVNAIKFLYAPSGSAMNEVQGS
jgi:hypothetical protein